VKHKVELIIFLLLGLTSLVYLFPFVFVEAAKLQSGVTINAPSTTQTEKICDDMMDNDNDGDIDADDADCVAAPAGPATENCGLKIESAVPINYGQLNPGQESQVQRVDLRNVGFVSGKIMVKGGDWISDAAGNPTVSGPEITHVSITSIPWSDKAALKSNAIELGVLGPDDRTSLWYQLKVPVSGFSGSLHQELSIDLICI
jgi:hypothetical protein